MKRQRFSNGVQPLSEDLNALNENVEEAVADLLSLFGSSDNKLLFSPTDPIVESVSGTVINITTPSQGVAIGGHVYMTHDYVESFDHGGADMWIRVFFVARRVPIHATRKFISVNPATEAPIIQNLVTTVQDMSRVDVVYLYTTDLGEDPGEPILGPGDIGFVELAEILIDSGDETVTTTEENIFTLPQGTAISAAPHASQHLSTGSDPIPLAALNSAAEMSSEGLMPKGALAASLSAITDLTADTTSPYVKVTDYPDTYIDQSGNLVKKVSSIGLRLAPSLQPVVVNNEDALGVSFLPKNNTNGLSDFAARQDHTHTTLDTGYLYERVEVELSPGLLDQIVPITLSNLVNINRDRIISINLFWQPANIQTGFTKHKIEVGYFQDGIKSYGARTIITGPNTFSLDFGSEGFTYIKAAVVNEVQSWTTPAYSDGSTPTSGKILCEVISLRQGAV